MSDVIDFKTPQMPRNTEEGRRDQEHRRVANVTRKITDSDRAYVDSVLQELAGILANLPEPITWTPPNREYIGGGGMGGG